MYQRSETFIRGHDGVRLFFQKWLSENSVGSILITHGQAEHSECYLRLVQALEKENWNILSWDLRGHGKSDGVRGYVQDFDDYVLDYQIFIDTALAQSEVKNKPVVILAHSMGGLIQLCSLLQRQKKEITAQILSSPLLGVAVDVPAWKDTGAAVIHKLFPQFTLGNEVKNEDLTRDPEVIREYEKDPYRHGKISSGAYLGFKREMPIVTSRASEIQLPTLLHISDHDPIVSTEAAIRFFDQLQNENKRLKIFENGKHELYHDTCREEVYKTVIDFLNEVRNIHDKK